jgi:hypothetical protein
MRGTESSTPTMDTPRTLLAGEIDRVRNVYVLTLDGNEIVETTDESIASAAANARRAGRSFTVELEANPAGGRQLLVELKLVPANGAAASPQPANTAIAKSAPPPAQPIVRRSDIPTHLISQPRELAEQLEQMQRDYNVLSPAIAVSQMAPGYGANLAVVKIDPTVTFNKEKDPSSGTGPDTYYSKFMFQGDEQKRALNKQGLLKISQAAGIQWDPHHCRRLDDGRERFYWRWQYYGGIRTHDGQWQPLTATRELDLRDGAGEAGQMTANQLVQARARGNEICETKAMERAIRGLGIRQVYTVDELKKPFLIVRFSFTPDMSDPEIKKFVTQQAMSGIGALYSTSAAAPALPPPPADEVDDDIDATMQSLSADEKTARRHTETSAPPAKAKPDPFAETPNWPTVAKVEKASGKQGKTGRDWTRYDVTFSTGEIASTFSQTMQQLIDEAVTQKAAVKYSTSPNEGYNDKIETFAIVDTRQGSLPMEEKL